jgi:hypothetical protein
VLVCQCKEIGGNGALIGLFEARETEWPGDKETRGYVRRRGWLMWMKRAPVVSWGTEFVSGIRISQCQSQLPVTLHGAFDKSWADRKAESHAMHPNVPTGGQLATSLLRLAYGIEGVDDFGRGLSYERGLFELFNPRY